jgi:hypothetical protein
VSLLRGVDAERFDLAAFVGTAGRADAVRPLRLSAPWADVDARRADRVRGTPLVAARLGRFALRDRHRGRHGTRDPQDRRIPSTCGTPVAVSSPDELDDDFRKRHPRFTGENLERHHRLAERVRELADQKGVRPAQRALAWVLSRGEDVVPIPGTKRRGYLEHSAAASEIELTDEELERLDAEFPRGAAAGDRCAGMSSVGR